MDVRDWVDWIRDRPLRAVVIGLVVLAVAFVGYQQLTGGGRETADLVAETNAAYANLSGFATTIIFDAKTGFTEERVTRLENGVVVGFSAITDIPGPGADLPSYSDETGLYLTLEGKGCWQHQATPREFGIGQPPLPNTGLRYGDARRAGDIWTLDASFEGPAGGAKYVYMIDANTHLIRSVTTELQTKTVANDGEPVVETRRPLTEPPVLERPTSIC